MLLISHLFLVLILITGFSITRYQSEWNRHIEYSASVAKLNLAPHISFLSSSVAGINYANLMMPTTKQMLSSLEDLEFLEVVGKSDYSDQSVQIRYFKRFDYLWRVDVKDEEIEEGEQKLDLLKAQIELAKSAENKLRLGKLEFIQKRVQRDYEALVESRYISNNVYIPWAKPAQTQDAFYLDEELCTLNIVLPLINQNGGEVWAVFDASDLTVLKHSLVKEILTEAVIALVISLVLIGWVAHWIVAPLKSLANHMRTEDVNGNTALPEFDRGDEIGQLARAYKGLLIKLDDQLTVLRNQSDTDPLTGLGSRHKYSRTVLPYLKKNLAQGHYVGLVVCDIDNFKPFNDIYGHTEGDNALSIVGEKIKQLAERNDLAFRYGGEEFVIFCARSEMSELTRFTEQLRQEIAELGVIHGGNQPHGVVTISVGGAAVKQDNLNVRFDSYQDLQEAMFNAADKALYQCKQQGRNRVLWSSSLDSNSK